MYYFLKTLWRSFSSLILNKLINGLAITSMMEITRFFKISYFSWALECRFKGSPLQCLEVPDYRSLFFRQVHSQISSFLWRKGVPWFLHEPKQSLIYMYNRAHVEIKIRPDARQKRWEILKKSSILDYISRPCASLFALLSFPGTSTEFRKF